MNQFKTYLMFRKFAPFWTTRLAPVAVIWASVVATYQVLSSWIESLLASSGQTHLAFVPIASFADGKLVGVLFGGVLAIIGALTVMQLNVSNTAKDRERMTRFFHRLLDEVSSASTHVGAALAAAMAHQFIQDGHGALVWNSIAKGNAATAFGYVGIGFLTFSYVQPFAGASPHGDSNASAAE